VADARAKSVLNALLSQTQRTTYAIDRFRQLREPLGRGDIIEVPYLSAFTITADGHTGTTPAAVTTNILSCQANLHPSIFLALQFVEQVQLMDGSWGAAVAADALNSLKNSMDETLLRTYVAQSLCWTTGTASTYHTNVAGDALTEDDLLNAKALILASDGVMEQNLALFVSSYGEGAIASIAGFVPNGQAAEQGILGIPRIGSVYGMPVYSTNSVRRNLTATATASVTSGGVFTITVPAGHGFVAGMPIITEGATNDVDAATAITSTTSTSITVTYGSSTASPNGACTVSSRIGSTGAGTSMNLLCDTSGIFVAQQRMPSLRIVADYDSTDDALQLWSLWGRIGLAGRAICIHSPGSSVA
jgi:hypothetical protein